MKAPICGHCHEPVLLPNGDIYYMGRVPSFFPFPVTDARCKKVTKVTARDWNGYRSVEGKLETGIKPLPIRALGPGGNRK